MPPWHNRFAGRTSRPAHRVGAPGPETKPTVGNQGKGGAAPEATAEVAGAPRTTVPYPDVANPWPGGTPGREHPPWMDPGKLAHAGGEGKATLEDNRYCDLCGGIGTVAALESPGGVGVCSFCLERLLRMFYRRFGRPRTDRLAP